MLSRQEIPPDTGQLTLIPLALKRARLLVGEWHRHHLPPTGGLFAIGAASGGVLVAAAIVGRPTARALQDGFTAEVTRLVTNDTPHAASKLYAACWRAARAMGYHRLITYVLASETGTSVQAAGWKVLYTTKDRPNGWNTPSRPRTVKAPTEAKTLWEVRL